LIADPISENGLGTRLLTEHNHQFFDLRFKSPTMGW